MGGGGSEVWLPHSFPLRPSTIQGSHLHAILPPLVHQRGGAGGGHSGADRQECCGACSTSFPRLLQPSIFSVEDLGVLETRHRSLDPQSLRGRVTFPDGDHPVCSSGRLDGLHRSQASVPAGPCPSGFSTLPSVCGTGQSVPVLCSLLWPIHGSAGLLPGHGSCSRHSPFLGYPHEAVPRRLACPVVLSRLSPTRPSRGSRSLSRARHCSQPREVTPRTFASGSASQGGDRCTIFQGFSITESRRQATINRWRVSILRRSSSQYLALAAGHALIPLPSCSGRSSSSAIAPALSPPILGLRGSVHQDPLVLGLPQRPQMVGPPSPSTVRGVSPTNLSGSGLLLRRLGRGVGSSLRFSNRFRPLGSRTERSLYQRQRASCRPRGPTPLPVFSGREECVSVLRQQHSGVLSPQGGRHEVTLPQLADSGDSPLDRIPLDPPGTPVHPGVSQRAGGLSRPHQLPHTEWSLHTEVFQSLSRQWPVQIDLFATSDNRRCSIYFSPFRDPMAAGTDAFLQRWDGLQAYAFPPWSIIPRVLAKLRMSQGMRLTLVAPYWPQRAWFADLLHLSLAPLVALPLRQDLLRLPRSHCLYQGLHRLRLHAWRLSGAS